MELILELAAIILPIAFINPVMHRIAGHTHTHHVTKGE